jgi:hypothetical protein
MTVDVFSSDMGDEQRVTADTVIKFRRGDAALWVTRNPVLYSGEPGVESDTGKFKIGDGVTPWTGLPYYIDQDAITTMVAQMIAAGGGGGGGGGISDAVFQAHVNAESPHPVYDDGTSFLLRYQNAKV